MTTDIDICNRALIAMGSRAQIASLSGSTLESIRCNQLYASTRNQLLRGCPWGFASTFAALTLFKAAPGTPENTGSAVQWNSSFPAPGWLYSYRYPDDCVFLRAIQAGANLVGSNIFPPGVTYFPMPLYRPTRFIITSDYEGAVILKTVTTNARNAIARYTRLVTDIDMYDELFIEYFVKALAGKLALTLTGDKSLATGLFNDVNTFMIEARIATGNEELQVVDEDPDWIRVRTGATAAEPAYIAPWGALF